MDTLTNFDQLVKMADGCEKVKLFDCYGGQWVKFYNGRIWEVEVSAETYDRMYQFFDLYPAWDLIPQVTSGGWIAKPTAQELARRHRIARAIDDLNEDLSGERTRFADKIPFQGEPMPESDEQEVSQEQINQAAKEYGATHVSKFGPVYFRKNGHPHSIEVCKFERGQGFTRWTQDYRSYIPEWAGVIA